MPQPKYQNYTDKELNQALASIDGKTYPENLKNLVDEVTKRKQNAVTQNTHNPSFKESAEDKELAEQRYIKDYWDPNQAEKEQKKVSRNLGYAAILIFLGVFSLPAYFNSYLLGQQYYEVFYVLSWITATIVLVVSTAHSMQNKTVTITDKQRTFFGITTRKDEHYFGIFAKCIFVIICALISYFIAARTLPVLAHNYLLDNKRQSIVVTVADKRHRYRRKHCNGRVYIEEYKHAQVDYICSMFSKERWENIKVGNKLRLFGSQSKIGFLVTGARKE